MKKLLIILIFISSPAFALKYQFDDNGELYVLGFSCWRLQKEVDQWRELFGKLEEGNSNIELDCEFNKDSTIPLDRKINISKIIPEIMVEMNDVCPISNGPNCWNSSLVINNILPYFRYTSDREISFWLGSDLCEKRMRKKDIEPGDIIAIRTTTSLGGLTPEVHAFTHITKKMSFSKNGFSKESPYSIMDPQKVFEIYGVKQKCQFVTEVSDECPNYTEYYSCKSIEDYLGMFEVSDQLSEIMDMVDTIACNVQGHHFTRPFQQAESRDFIDSLNDIIKYYSNNFPDKDQLSVEEQFILRSIQIRTDSCYNSIY